MFVAEGDLDLAPARERIIHQPLIVEVEEEEEEEVVVVVVVVVM